MTRPRRSGSQRAFDQERDGPRFLLPSTSAPLPCRRVASMFRKLSQLTPLSCSRKTSVCAGLEVDSTIPRRQRPGHPSQIRRSEADLSFLIRLTAGLVWFLGTC